MSPVGLSILLFFVGLALLVLDIFAPSHLLLTFLGVACMLGGVYQLFQVSSTAGWTSLAAVLVGAPTITIVGLLNLPRTWLGKKVIPPPPPANAGAANPDAANLARLVGKVGEAVSPLRPIGVCRIDGQRVECAAESDFIDAGQRVEVVEFRDTATVVVRALG